MKQHYKFKYVFKGQVEMYRMKFKFEEPLANNFDTGTPQTLFKVHAGEGVRFKHDLIMNNLAWLQLLKC